MIILNRFRNIYKYKTRFWLSSWVPSLMKIRHLLKIYCILIIRLKNFRDLIFDDKIKVADEAN